MSNLGPQFDTSHPAAQAMQSRGYDLSKGTHGTVSFAGETPDYILPSRELDDSGGATVHPGVTHEDRAYYSALKPESPSMAQAGGRRWAEMAQSAKRGPDGRRPRMVVHQVQAEGKISGDPVLNPNGGFSHEMTADRLKVVDTDWNPPPQGSPTPMQGTLPKENWNRYSDHGPLFDMNQHAYGREPNGGRSEMNMNPEQFSSHKPQIHGQLKADF